MQGWTANGNQETWRDRNVLCFDRVGGVLENHSTVYASNGCSVYCSEIIYQ